MKRGGAKGIEHSNDIKRHKKNRTKTAIEKKSAHGQWQQVEEDIAADILTGRIPPRTQLPTEADLMERFGVGRHTIRRAISRLQSRGLVQVEQGRGTFVGGERLEYRLSERTRFSQNLLDQGREPFGQTIREEEILAPAAVADALRLPRGEPVYHIVRRGFADEEPITLSNAYYPVRRFPGFDKARRSGRSVSLILAEYGVPISACEPISWCGCRHRKRRASSARASPSRSSR